MAIRSAVEAFVDDEQGRHLRRRTSGQRQTLLNAQLFDWARERGRDYLDDLTALVLAKFRAHWSQYLGNGQNTARRKRERLCGFFHFLHSQRMGCQEPCPTSEANPSGTSSHPVLHARGIREIINAGSSPGSKEMLGRVEAKTSSAFSSSKLIISPMSERLTASLPRAFCIPRESHSSSVRQT